MMKVLIIGGVAAGMKAAAKTRREHPDWEVTVLEKGNRISYAGCGLPYYVGDLVKEESELVMRNPEDVKRAYNINVLTGHEATQIDLESKTVKATDLASGIQKEFEYDKLVLATGASPFVPPIPGITLPSIYTVRTVESATELKRRISQLHGQEAHAVVVGGGMIGLEVVENLAHRGMEVSVVELAEQVLPGFDLEIALLVQKHLENHGVKVFTGEKVSSFEPSDGGRVVVNTTARKLPADLVVWATGVRPNVKLAKDAGIEIGPTGAIKVDRFMRTSAPDVFAVGDCAESVNLITGKPAWYPMGSTANKMGRVAALNLEPHDHANAGPGSARAEFDGVLGTTVLKLFELNIARTGLSEAAAKSEGFDVETVLVPANDRAHYYPGYKTIITKLVADRKSHKLLGAQVLGEGIVDKPIDTLAAVISYGGTVDDLQTLDLAYAPPFSMALSTTIVAANVMSDKLLGKLKGISPIALKARLHDPLVQIVDVRSEAEVLMGMIPGAIHIPMEELENRLSELDQSKEQVMVCRVGQRAYWASIVLKQHGFKNVRILDGGTYCWPFETV